jgi:peptidyl-prolyl cis-trans isomerase SurA
MKKKGASIPPHVIEEHIDTIVREQFGGDKSAFIRTLQAQGFTLERFRQMEEEKIIVQAMRSQQVKSTTIIPESKIREYYQSHLADFTSEEQVKLRMLVMKKGVGGGSDDSKLKMMQEIREKIVSGAQFADLARMYDESSSQEQGGDWGWINRKTLNEALTKVAFALKPGEVSKILDLSGNYYVLYCEARKAAISKPFSELRDTIEKQLIQEERQKQQEDWIAKLRRKAYIKIY